MCAPSLRLVVNDCWVLDGDPDKVNPNPGSCAYAKEDLVVSAKKGL